MLQALNDLVLFPTLSGFHVPSFSGVCLPTGRLDLGWRLKMSYKNLTVSTGVLVVPNPDTYPIHPNLSFTFPRVSQSLEQDVARYFHGHLTTCSI